MRTSKKRHSRRRRISRGHVEKKTLSHRRRLITKLLLPKNNNNDQQTKFIKTKIQNAEIALKKSPNDPQHVFLDSVKKIEAISPKVSDTKLVEIYDETKQIANSGTRTVLQKFNDINNTVYSKLYDYKLPIFVILAVVGILLLIYKFNVPTSAPSTVSINTVDNAASLLLPSKTAANKLLSDPPSSSTTTTSSLIPYTASSMTTAAKALMPTASSTTSLLPSMTTTNNLLPDPTSSLIATTSSIIPYTGSSIPSTNSSSIIPGAAAGIAGLGLGILVDKNKNKDNGKEALKLEILKLKEKIYKYDKYKEKCDNIMKNYEKKPESIQNFIEIVSRLQNLYQKILEQNIMELDNIIMRLKINRLIKSE